MSSKSRVSCTSSKITRRQSGVEVVPKQTGGAGGSVLSSEGTMSKKYILLGAHRVTLNPIRSTETVNLGLCVRTINRKPLSTAPSSSPTAVTPSSVLTSVLCRTSLTVAQIELGATVTTEFSELPLTHDLNGPGSSSTESNDLATAEVLVGFRTGEIVVWDSNGIRCRFNAQKYNRVDDTAATCVIYLRGNPSENSTKFLACHASGCVYLYDTMLYPAKEVKSMEVNLFPDSVDVTPFCKMIGTKPTLNPSFCLCVAKSAISCAACCPRDQSLVAFGSRDGQLRVSNIEAGVISFSHKSQYGAFLCVAWSPGQTYLAAGSEDDTVYVYSMRGHCVAKLVGHRSWPSTLTIGTQIGNVTSVLGGGQDGLVIVWYLNNDELSVKGPVVIEPSAVWCGLHMDSCVVAKELPGVIISACSQGYIRMWAEE
eukprot:PhF_6_TR13866/c0_g1_i1/m.22247